jgi:esterase/lipase
VLFHGLTNNPAQFRILAPQIHALGANVYVPRMPFHGFADRLTNALAALTAEELIAQASAAVDVGRGLGERVAVLGISMGGLQCAYLGATREDVAVSVPVAPDFSVLGLPAGAMAFVRSLVLALPNVFLWWDPRIREAMRPLTAYPRFCTHALMQTLRIGDSVRRLAQTMAPRAALIRTIVNRADPAVNNAVTQQVAQLWQSRRPAGIDYIECADLPENHDIIDPGNPVAQITAVYPRLIDALSIRTP